mgnify:CR=1 FL=1
MTIWNHGEIGSLRYRTFNNRRYISREDVGKVPNGMKVYTVYESNDRRTTLDLSEANSWLDRAAQLINPSQQPVDNTQPGSQTASPVSLSKNVSCGEAPAVEKFAGLMVQGYGANFGQSYYSGWSSGDTYNLSHHGGTVGYSVQYVAGSIYGVSPSNFTSHSAQGEGTTIWNKGSGLNAATVLDKLNSDFNKFSTQSGVGKSGELPHTTGEGTGWLMDLTWSDVTVDSDGGLTSVCCDGLDFNNGFSQDASEGNATAKGLRRFAILFGSSGGVYNAVLREASNLYHKSGFIYGDDDRNTLVGYHDYHRTNPYTDDDPQGTGTLYNIEDFLAEFRSVNNLPDTEDFAIIECYGAIPFYSSGMSDDND